MLPPVPSCGMSQRAGIGVNAGRIRALGGPIRGGEAQHTGCIPL